MGELGVEIWKLSDCLWKRKVGKLRQRAKRDLYSLIVSQKGRSENLRECARCGDLKVRGLSLNERGRSAPPARFVYLPETNVLDAILAHFLEFSLKVHHLR
ncbi:hypothetical protein TNCV_96191 [Trichonephila clavipes]|nr:hypothetical protein TNCV_96191 [Trichonephila clavipes]